VPASTTENSLIYEILMAYLGVLDGEISILPKRSAGDDLELTRTSHHVWIPEGSGFSDCGKALPSCHSEPFAVILREGSCSERSRTRKVALRN